jgi:hypothetical protein
MAGPVGCGRPPQLADETKPTIQVKSISQAPGHVFELTGPGVGQAAEVFTVQVIGADVAMTGEYVKQPNRIVFTPRYPLTPGVQYRATFGSVSADIELPKPKLEPTTLVEQIYPSGDVLPENLLRFYVHFSAAMGRGDVYRHVHLIDDKGKEIELPFLELDEEFWDPEQKRFTLFFDPGRIKRGVKPREDLGPALEEGRSYRLVIDQAWLDARGAPLKGSFTKLFKVVAPDDRCPDPKTWKLESPPASSKEPLTVTFPEPLDHGMLRRLPRVVNEKGEPLAGQVRVDQGESRWQFTPAQPWQAGEYQLITATTLEDRSGNSIERPFELDVFNPIQKTVQPGEVKLPFMVR